MEGNKGNKVSVNLNLLDPKDHDDDILKPVRRTGGIVQPGLDDGKKWDMDGISKFLETSNQIKSSNEKKLSIMEEKKEDIVGSKSTENINHINDNVNKSSEFSNEIKPTTKTSGEGEKEKSQDEIENQGRETKHRSEFNSKNDNNIGEYDKDEMQHGSCFGCCIF